MSRIPASAHHFTSFSGDHSSPRHRPIDPLPPTRINMDQQRRAIDALAPFLALSKSASSPRSAADLVTQAISAQNTYLFADLLQTAAIQSLRSDEQYASYYRLLEIFAFGTYHDYAAQQDILPQLTTQQMTKLRLLTLVTLSSSAPTDSTLSTATKTSDQLVQDSARSQSHHLSYESLRQSLDLQTSSQIEALVTEAIYAELLVAKLDPAHGVVQIASVAPCRDIRPGQLTSLSNEVDAWAARCDSVLLELEGGIKQVADRASKRVRDAEERKREVEGVEALYAGRGGESSGNAGQSSGAGSLGLSGLADGDAMDVDNKEAGGSRSGRR